MSQYIPSAMYVRLKRDAHYHTTPYRRNLRSEVFISRLIKRVISINF